MHRICIFVACLLDASHTQRVQITRDRRLHSRAGEAWKYDRRPNLMSGSRSHHAGRGEILRSLTSMLLAYQPLARPATRHAQISMSKNRIGRHATHPLAVMKQHAADPSSLMTQFKKAFGWFTRPVVSVAVSVDWEGVDLLDENLQAFDDFHEAHPDVPLTHFLNAAYFTRPGVDHHAVREQTKRFLGPIDESGLHIHAWKSLVESSNVTFRSGPNFVDAAYNQEQGDVDFVSEPKISGATYRYKTKWWEVPKDTGYDVPLGAYTVDEIQAIVANSKGILEEHGIRVGSSFRCGAYLASSNVREAIRREGIVIDSSAIDTEKWLPGCSFSDIVNMTWPDTTNTSQPFAVKTPAGTLLEMPDTGALADYANTKDMIDHIDSTVQQLDFEDRFAHIGFHQETAAEFVPLVIQAIAEIKKKHKNRVVFETLEASGRRALSSQRLKWEPELRQSTIPLWRNMQQGMHSAIGLENVAKPKQNLAKPKRTQEDLAPRKPQEEDLDVKKVLEEAARKVDDELAANANKVQEEAARKVEAELAAKKAWLQRREQEELARKQELEARKAQAQAAAKKTQEEQIAKKAQDELDATKTQEEVIAKVQEEVVAKKAQDEMLARKTEEKLATKKAKKEQIVKNAQAEAAKMAQEELAAKKAQEQKEAAKKAPEELVAKKAGNEAKKGGELSFEELAQIQKETGEDAKKKLQPTTESYSKLSFEDELARIRKEAEEEMKKKVELGFKLSVEDELARIREKAEDDPEKEQQSVVAEEVVLSEAQS